MSMTGTQTAATKAALVQAGFLTPHDYDVEPTDGWSTASLGAWGAFARSRNLGEAVANHPPMAFQSLPEELLKPATGFLGKIEKKFKDAEEGFLGFFKTAWVDVEKMFGIKVAAAPTAPAAAPAAPAAPKAPEAPAVKTETETETGTEKETAGKGAGETTEPPADPTTTDETETKGKEETKSEKGKGSKSSKK